jgi:hypothetical protein
MQGGDGSQRISVSPCTRRFPVLVVSDTRHRMGQLIAARSLPGAELAQASAKIAQRVVECGIKRQHAVKSEQPDRPAGGGPFGDDPESR